MKIIQPSTLLFLILILLSCKSTTSGLTEKVELESDTLEKSSTRTLTIEALDLSEDMSRLSSKNDEILILIYELKDSLELDNPLFQERSIFDVKNNLKEIEWPINEDLNHHKLLLFLIEQDSETPIEQINPIIRVHYKKVLQAYRSKNYLELEKYLGDEDLIGAKIIEDFDSDSIQFDFDGIHKLDSYLYRVRLK